MLPLVALVVVPIILGTTAEAAIGTPKVPAADTSHLEPAELARLQLQAKSDTALGGIMAASLVALMFGGVLVFVIYMIWNSM